MSDYATKLQTQINDDLKDAAAVARDADVTIGVAALDNPVGETVSMRAALGQKAGIWYWCVFCRVLSVLVQKGHCDAVLTNAPTPWWVYVRAGAAFLAVPLILAGLLWWLL